MPIYEFNCKTCGAVIEHICKVEDRPHNIECSCGGKLDRKIACSGAIRTDNNALWLDTVIEQCVPDYVKQPPTTRTEFFKYLGKNDLVMP